MILTDQEITLELSDNKMYLAELIRRHEFNLLNDRGIERYLKFVEFLWVGWAYRKVRGGVVYFSLIPGIGWTFDAYKEDAVLKKLDNGGDFGYRASCLVLEWFMKLQLDSKLFAIVDEQNRGAVALAKRLGFFVVKNVTGLITLKKEF